MTTDLEALAVREREWCDDLGRNHYEATVYYGGQKFSRKIIESLFCPTRDEVRESVRARALSQSKGLSNG